MGKFVHTQMRTDSSLVAMAYAFSMDAHQGQLYGDQDYFEGHVKQVVVNLSAYDAALTDPLASYCAAYLHDTVEDTQLTLQEIKDTFGLNIHNLVDSLTWRKGESRMDYLYRLSSNEQAIYIKLADSITNFKKSIATSSPEKMLKYLDTMRYLTLVLTDKKKV